jgi:Protein of unknown function (DUF3040)
MLNDWEQAQLADIGRRLRADRSLGRVITGPTRRERRWLLLRRHFYPAGYLLCAVTYMILATGTNQVRTMVGAVVVGIAVWLVAELRAAAPPRSS